MATQPKALLSTIEWGGVILLALLAVAAALAYFEHNATPLEWLKWGSYAYVASALVWLIYKRRRTFQEGRQHGGPAEGVRRVLGPGPSVGARMAFAAFVVAGNFAVWHLHGLAMEVAGIAFVIALLGVIGRYAFATPWVPREGRASGIYIMVIYLLLVVSLGLYLGLPLLLR